MAADSQASVVAAALDERDADAVVHGLDFLDSLLNDGEVAAVLAVPKSWSMSDYLS